MQALYWDTLWVWHPDKRFPRPVSLNSTSLRRQGRHSPPFFFTNQNTKDFQRLAEGRGTGLGFAPQPPRRTPGPRSNHAPHPVEVIWVPRIPQGLEAGGHPLTLPAPAPGITSATPREEKE